jgi:hypothetical protein
MHIKHLNRHAATVLLYLLLNTDDRCEVCTSQKGIVENTQVTQSNVGAALECLLDHKMIEVVEKPRKRGVSTTYRVLCVQLSDDNIDAAIKERGAVKAQASDDLITHFGWAQPTTQPIYPNGKK